MTTKVTVDAHAGWPVKVKIADTYNGETTTSEVIVVPNEVRDFYVTNTRSLDVSELPRPVPATEAL